MVLGTAALLPSGGCQRHHLTLAPTPVQAPVNELAKPSVDLEVLSARVGVKAGPLAHPGLGPDASLLIGQGAILVRRAGEERFNEVDPNATTTPLYAGDQVRAGQHAQVTVALADYTLIQLAEETAVAIGNRGVGADPASAAAVLYGVARFSISPRARGEGAFLTTAGSVLIGAKGTVYCVAVTAGGRVRVGLEHGEAEVAGPAALNKPVSLETAQAVIVDEKGVVGKPEPFKRDDWGDWRYGAEAEQKVDAVARLHADHLVSAEGRLDSYYLVLKALATSASTLTWQAEATTKAKGAGDYKATATDRAAAIEATYRLAGEIARLTNAALSDAFILTELYTRHPKEVATVFNEYGQEVTGALLYNKKLQVVSDVYLGPMRPAYYAHTGRGRARAASLDLPVPAVFTQVRLPELASAEIAKRLPPGLYIPPRLDATTRGHPLWQRAPKLGWDDRLTLQPVPPRQGAWYVAPGRVNPQMIAGVAPQGPLPAVLAPTPAIESAKTDLLLLIPPLPPQPDAGFGP
jgi:FecR protein